MTLNSPPTRRSRYSRLREKLLGAVKQGSSLRKAESHYVEKQDLILQFEVIAEMCMKSTNPSVSTIAYQSLAVLHTSLSRHESSEYQGVLKTLREQLEGFTQPKNLDTAAFLACVVVNERRLISKPLSQEIQEVRSIMQCIFDQTDIPLFKIRNWHLKQLVYTVDSSPMVYNADEEKTLMIELIDGLSRAEDWTLQQDLLIRYLLRCRSDHEMRLSAVLSEKKKNPEIWR